jgi:hypothetical protein
MLSDTMLSAIMLMSFYLPMFNQTSKQTANRVFAVS